MPKLAYIMGQINPYLQIFVYISLRVFIETMLAKILGRFGESDPYIYIYIFKSYNLKKRALNILIGTVYIYIYIPVDILRAFVQ